MPYMSVSPDQLASAGSYISRYWGDCGYRIVGVESRTHAVSVFRVVAFDGTRFCVLVDRWSNCRYLDTHGSDEGLAELVREMHEVAARP